MDNFKYYVAYNDCVGDIFDTKDEAIAFIERALENDSSLVFSCYSVMYGEFLPLKQSTQVTIYIGEG